MILKKQQPKKKIRKRSLNKKQQEYKRNNLLVVQVLPVVKLGENDLIKFFNFLIFFNKMKLKKFSLFFLFS